MLEDEPVRCGGGGEMLDSFTDSLLSLGLIGIGSITTRAHVDYVRVWFLVFSIQDGIDGNFRK